MLFKVDEKFVNFKVVRTNTNDCVIGKTVFRCKITGGIGNCSPSEKFTFRVFLVSRTRVLISEFGIFVSASDRCLVFNLALPLKIPFRSCYFSRVISTSTKKFSTRCLRWKDIVCDNYKLISTEQYCALPWVPENRSI